MRRARTLKFTPPASGLGGGLEIPNFGKYTFSKDFFPGLRQQ